ncbi:MAG: hypothetical protein IJN92_01155 [Lachnospiraceae bacterium]|nr:hypothetical protein [Lachnospiraceae bacterium]
MFLIDDFQKTSPLLFTCFPWKNKALMFFDLQNCFSDMVVCFEIRI